MADNKSIHDTIKTSLHREGMIKTWRALLFNYVSQLANNGRDDVKIILQDKFFRGVKKTKGMENPLAGLTMGQIAGLYEFSLAHCDAAARKTAGQYFTPDDVATLMADKAVKNLVQYVGNKEQNNKEKIWCDPCAGIGNLAYYLIARQNTAEDFLLNNIYFIDRDPLALFIARVLLTVHFQQKNKNLFHAIEKKFITADFLTARNLPPFDYALFNPPYGKVDKNTNNPNHAPDLYALFIERVMAQTKGRGGGFVAVTPQSFTHAQKFLSLRQQLLAQAKKITIYNFDNVPDGLFNNKKFGSINSNHANSTRAAITIFQHKTAASDGLEFFITPWLRWRAAERATLLASVDHYLTAVPYVTATIFPKVHDHFQNLYQLVQGHDQNQATEKTQKILGDMLSATPTKYKLFVPTTPRYFISALLKKPNRTSYRTLYFFSSETRDQAYVLLNSSFCYWWWRVTDGGMGLSQRTLLTMPWVAIAGRHDALVKKIKWSEKNNKVIKKNAGRDNENVKHDIALLAHLNRAVVGGLNHVAPIKIPSNGSMRRARGWQGSDFLKLHYNSILS
ncbi:MAG: N-6 DNA methylase [Hydrotalea sp.]|nr:N-6 DNA methylase [Hydrotalea sp.]